MIADICHDDLPPLLFYMLRAFMPLPLSFSAAAAAVFRHADIFRRRRLMAAATLRRH